MREWNEDPLPCTLRRADHLTERGLPDESLDRELPDWQQDARIDERDLACEPCGAVRDLRRTRLAIAGTTRGFTGKALRDRRAIWKMQFVDARACEPTSQLGTRATGERETGGELDRTRGLADDHHAIARMSSDDGECARDEACVCASCARTDLRMQLRESERTLAIGARFFYRRLVFQHGV